MARMKKPPLVNCTLKVELVSNFMGPVHGVVFLWRIRGCVGQWGSVQFDVGLSNHFGPLLSFAFDVGIKSFDRGRDGLHATVAHL